MSKCVMRTGPGAHVPATLTSAENKIEMRAQVPLETAKTHCCYCAMQCGMMLTDMAEGVAVTPREHPINKRKALRLMTKQRRAL